MGNIKDELLKNRLLVPKWIKVFYHLDDGINITQLAKRVHITYGYLLPILNNFIEKELVFRQKDNREVHLYLTDKGRLVKQATGVMLHNLK